ncbi:MAG: nitroreductase family protein [Deltaproteobacteria bacterium]|nr:nitroreductase family protein [Deltaproteobacteria bacterium]MBW2118088.1 nitroreductase family protein [Deltaproteobacteria bacterium]MBW2342448.1 nitroreductase family protein [Deltaproteobacteria bacterium]
MEININVETCIQCFLCTAVCPFKIFEKNESEQASINNDRMAFCVKCGHCMAICKSKSITIKGLSYDDNFHDLQETNIDLDSFINFLANRRSIRNFKDKEIPKEILNNIIDATSYAPYGGSPRNLMITVVQNKEILDKTLTLMSNFYDNLVKWLKNPIARYMIKRNVTQETFNTLTHHILPAAEKGYYNTKSGNDNIMRNASAVLIIHANIGAEEHTHDAIICITYAMLAAHSFGLGATIIGLIPPAINKVKKLKELFQIPEENEAVMSLILGYPKYKYKRTIKRGKREINWI